MHDPDNPNPPFAPEGDELDVELMEQRSAVVYTGRSRPRKRFQENTVTELESDEAARARAQDDPKLRAARVVGPFRSSEGFRLYYLVRWLD